MVQIVPGGEDCSSVQTLGGVCTVLEAQKPAAFILENVDMESKGKKADDSQPLDSKGWLYIFSGIFWTYVGTSGNMGRIIASNSTVNPFTHLLKAAAKLGHGTNAQDPAVSHKFPCHKVRTKYR